MRTLIELMVVMALCAAASAAAQQAPQAAPAAPAAAPAAPAAAPEAAPAAPATAPPAESSAATSTSASEAAPGVPVAASPATATPATRSPEEARRALARARLRLQLDRARAVQAERKAAADEAEPEARQVHGDAGAPFAFGVSLDSSFYPDASYDVYADDDATSRLGVWAAYDVATLRTDAFLALELGYGAESEQASVLGGHRTQLDTHLAHVAAQLRWVPLAILQPHARLAAGAAFLDAELRENGTTYEDGSTGILGDDLFDSLISPFASLGLGVTLRTPTRLFEDSRGRLASLSAGLMFEGGYTLAAPVDVALDGPGPNDQGIALREPGLGELKRSGPYLRGSIVARF